jgi:hypothetical protein
MIFYSTSTKKEDRKNTDTKGKQEKMYNEE